MTVSAFLETLLVASFIFLVCGYQPMLKSTTLFRSLLRTRAGESRSLATAANSGPFQLVLVRHGESSWNQVDISRISCLTTNYMCNLYNAGKQVYRMV